MTATARKLPAADDRAELAAALKAAAEAREALERHRRAIDKTRAAQHASDRAIEAARKGIAESSEEYGLALAEASAAAADDDVAPPTNKARLARAALADAEDESSALNAALAKLRRDTPAWERHVAEADAEVEAAISAILSRHAQKLLDQLAELIQQTQPLRESVLGLLEAHADRAVGFAGQQPLSEQLAQARLLAMCYGHTELIAAEVPWTAIRARLRAEPFAVIEWPGA
jgi:uncharacterized protein YhaN